ncbi:KdsC family phosphatase [Cyclobacterium marinum]|uniref:3-deoxy-D-manno-octulosonate 8-phosphate phosphatase KdsC n=1 Tax=Cyclobacterium marinum (strain ATCC 25205 / DSM 745 / LMG 13164 / NCIMB 1802) TaxID=880070 RepID=G0IUI0_CYCMS|nr:HAD hydrolase family protein [Cyclobacterium marinum]AEL24743.1 3-deoxy-D-manno-octulosonate 8-phosphate phosphatase, YrbI family [Cyclobacterium marinum DSM 745]MBR9773573.1 HAD hydrolase family protein [Cytophagales bacterium]|tara:strand:+ start:98834 stop:99379 length:546 start_codon:yes stop_codon:yes gene_type:complete
MNHFNINYKEVLSKAKDIKLIVTDLDGVLTDGGIVLDDNGMEYKRFQVKDGQIIRFLRESGIKTGIITGRDVSVSKIRCEQMGVDFHLHGVNDKWPTLLSIITEMGLKTNQVAYIGDDIIDMELLSHAGFSAAPADAIFYIKDKVDYVTLKKGGEGAFRELADLILYANENLPSSITSTAN